MAAIVASQVKFTSIVALGNPEGAYAVAMDLAAQLNAILSVATRATLQVVSMAAAVLQAKSAFAFQLKAAPFLLAYAQVPQASSESTLDQFLLAMSTQSTVL